jgi:hypothetical protein
MQLFFFFTAFLSLATAFNVYTARGTYFEVGEQIGKAAQQDISLTLQDPDIQTKVIPFMVTTTGKQLLEGFYVNSVKTYPHLIQELQGLAVGSGFSFEVIFMLNALDELKTYLGILDDHKTRLPDHCTDVMSNSFTPCWGHNEDGVVDNRHMTYFTNVTVVDAHGQILERFFAFTYPGTVAGDAYGWNHNGLAFSQNSVDASTLNYYGIPGQLTTRAVYGSKTVAEVISSLSTSTPALGYNFNVAYPEDNRFLNIEVDPLGTLGVHEVPSLYKTPKYKLPKESYLPYFYYHTNMYRVLSSPCESDPSSIHRMAVLAKYSAPNSTDDIQRMLGDTSDPLYPIYRDGTGPDSPYVTLTTVVYDFVANVANIFDGNPRTVQPFMQVPLWLEQEK